jgi:hypothetical protein
MDYCRRDLKLSAPIGLRWFQADADRYTLGKFQPAYHDIWLSSALTEADVAVTVAHECRHAWQYATYPANDFRLQGTPDARRWRERDAEEYARQFKATTRAYSYSSGQMFYELAR